MNQETINHSERAHAEFGPSSLKYVATCAGYHGKEGTSGAAEKGTRIHEALEVRDPSALHDEEEVKLYEAILADEEEILNGVFGDTPKIIERPFRRPKMAEAMWILCWLNCVPFCKAYWQNQRLQSDRLQNLVP